MVKTDPAGVLTGAHFIDGDYACAEGALAAGCRFFAGYPITPSTEIAERITQRFPLVGGLFIQMEDEMGSMNAVLGGAWSGRKSMTCTSGPGFSLMMENLGLGIMTETPCVLVNVQRGGPSTGLPTLPGQADMMQARWGSHGDYEIIALAPNSPQEAFDLMITCFNLAERYRVPVLFMMDECVGHMTERVVIPEADAIEVEPRRTATRPPDGFRPYEPGPDLVPEMPPTGKGYRFHITGLTHDERGYPVINADAQDKLVHRLVNKIRHNIDDIILLETDRLDDAEVVVLSYGITSRVVIPAIEKARRKGVKVGSIRLVTVWPFPEKIIAELAGRVRSLVMVEMNLGQVFMEMDRCARGQCRTYLVPHCGGWVHNPDDIYRVVMEASK